MTELSPLTLADWRLAYLEGASPRDLLAGRLAQLGGHDAAVWIHKATAEQLAQQVGALESLLAAAGGDRAALLARLPLFGVPFAAKDNIDVAGMPTTAACPAFSHVPIGNAHAVQRLMDAGAVCLGKTNLDQFATGLVGARSPYGRPCSAFDAARVSGGSSSGSAVAVARAEVAFSLGTDTAGSGRVPAGFNNLVGLKPTPGRVGTSGVLPACRTLDCISVFSLTVEDAAAVLAVIEGPEAQDAYSHFEPGPAQLPARLRIGVPATPDLSADYAPAWPLAVQLARELGHEIVPLDFAPLHAVAELLYDGPWVAERHAVVQDLLARDPEAIEPTVRRVIARAVGLTATDTFKAQYTLRAAQRDTAALWQQVDVLMVPTAPAHPSFAELDADPIGANARLGRYTNFVNLLGWCALALPSSFNDQGLPFGVTFIAPGQADAALARFGTAWQAAAALPLGATGMKRPPSTPTAWPATEATLPLAVVGAHLSGMPLNGQLTTRGATLREATTTAPTYRLHALPGTVPPKPGLQRVAEGGEPIAVEIWNVPLRHIGSLLALIPAPLGLGSVLLADGSSVHGFICEGQALAGATDITAYGGWRAYMADTHRA
ncbi:MULTISPECIES: allophanate hydrolase [unclassified Roseateles]|uniref:allophanate hydrolase n=1 Tax=unclassified Roseateles TaxID=2626991 RepID=UPI0006F49A54|nr:MULTISPECIES: allophanate hydrolase [unclassified Roseateles]KQW44954.1 allophanate hydrolase [Pelomonas sp. Root405]KRA70314.1 allophanate hydrolase [Pelomonas sp. Root662]